MSKTKKETYSGKHDFKQILIGQLKNQVIYSYKTKTPLAVVGPAGIGKTSIVSQAGEELSKSLGKPFKVTTLITSQMVPEDFTGIPIPDMQNKVVNFFKLGQLPTEGYGILHLDELNQADLSVQKPLFQLLGERRIGTYELPEGWGIVASMNPDGENYGTNKPSPALRRRMSWVEVKFDVSAFMSYAKENDFNEVIIEYLSRNPDKCLNETALKNDKVFSCPASWEKVSNILNVMKPKDTIADIMPICSGLIGFTYFKDFVRFFNDFSQDIDPKDIIHKYPSIRQKVLKFSSKGRTDVLTHLSDALAYLMLDLPTLDSTEFDTIKANFTKFYVDLPDDTAVYFGTKFHEVFAEAGKSDIKNKWVSALAEDEEASAKLLKMLSTTTKIAKEKEQLATQRSISKDHF